MSSLTLENSEVAEEELPASCESPDSGELIEEPSTVEELTSLNAFTGSFPCESGALVWTLIDYGFCIDAGCTTISEGAAWDLIELVVGGDLGKRQGLPMDPNVWMLMLTAAVCQLQHLNGM
jgi:hypothetical protein